MEEERIVKGILAYPINRASNFCVKAILLLARRLILLQNRARAKLAAKISPRKKPVKISRFHKIALKWTVKLLMMTKWLTTIAARIIKKINGLLTVPLLHFEGGRKLVRTFPFGSAIVELSFAVGKIIGALKLGTTEVLKNFATVTASLMLYRYGLEAAITTKGYMKALGCVLGSSWDILQILDPISLPLEVVPEINDMYDEIGIEDLKDKIIEEEGIDWPKELEKMNEIFSWEAIGTNEKKIQNRP